MQWRSGLDTAQGLLASLCLQNLFLGQIKGTECLYRIAHSAPHTTHPATHTPTQPPASETTHGPPACTQCQHPPIRYCTGESWRETDPPAAGRPFAEGRMQWHQGAAHRLRAKGHGLGATATPRRDGLLIGCGRRRRAHRQKLGLSGNKTACGHACISCQGLRICTPHWRRLAT